MNMEEVTQTPQADGLPQNYRKTLKTAELSGAFPHQVNTPSGFRILMDHGEMRGFSNIAGATLLPRPSHFANHSGGFQVAPIPGTRGRRPAASWEVAERLSSTQRPA